MAENKEIRVIYNIGEEEITLTPSIVQEYIVGSNSKITLPEFKMFTSLCKARKLNPFLREAYLIKYGSNPAQIVVSKQAIMKRGTLHPQFDGMKSGIIVLTKTGEEKERRGTFKRPDETLIGAWCEVYRKDWANSIFCSVSLEEIKNDKNPSWQKQPAVMAEKVAVVRAMRDAFVEDLGAMYSDDEMNTPDQQPQQEIIEQNEPIEMAIDEETGEVKLTDL